MHQCLKKKSHSPGVTAGSIRFRNGDNSVKVSSSPAVQREETDERHRGSGYDTRRLESTRSYGSELRREARDESAGRADDEDACMSHSYISPTHACQEKEKRMPLRHDSFHANIEMG